MTKKEEYDFGGFATVAGVKCTDGRTIMKHAFKNNIGKRVPLVWQHMHDSTDNILGHAILEDRDGSIYAFCKFNDTPGGKNGRTLVEHKDVDSLSIYANQLVENDGIVKHGNIREVSLVLAGANPGAKIDYIAFAHSDGSETECDDEAVIYTGKTIELKHEDTTDNTSNEESDESTIEEVLATLNPIQEKAVMALVASAVDAISEEPESEELKTEEPETEMSQGDKMKSNAFSDTNKQTPTPHLTHDQFNAIVADAKKSGSFKEAFLAHAVTYGIENIDFLFPDARKIDGIDFVQRDMGWVSVFFGGARKSPFSRIKSLSADITLEDARAKGYVKGALKVEEFFALAKRTTGPTTVYKKQKLDRDDIIDITDMDVVSWLKAEMRMMLDEEIARAGLVSDGRLGNDPDKIDETAIRPIWKDADFYAHNLELESTVTDGIDIIDAIAAARKEYKGTGVPKMFCTPDLLSSLLLIRDTLDHRLYRTVADLAAELRVSDIVEVPVMVGLEREKGSGQTAYDVTLLAIIVNPADYTYGADKGGSVSMFDDFDIDYNQYKYLIETRCSGCLTKPKSAIVVEQKKPAG